MMQSIHFVLTAPEENSGSFLPQMLRHSCAWLLTEMVTDLVSVLGEKMVVR